MPDYEQDAAGIGHNSNNVSDAARIADDLITLQAELEALEEKVKSVKGQISKLEERDLPNAMETLGVSSFTLPNGVVIEIDSGMSLSIAKDRKAEVIDYLMHNLELDEIVKYEFHAALPKGEAGQELARIIKEFCLEHEVSGNAVLDVHTGSVKSHITKIMKEGKKSVDLEKLGAYEWRKAKVNMPK